MKKTILITGASSGLGYEAALQLARLQHEIILLCRDKERGEKAVRDIQSASGNTSIHLYTANLSSQVSISAAAEQIKSDFKHLDVLLNNAGGVFADFELSDAGLEMTIATNHFNYFWCTYYLLDLLKATKGSRIINVASDSHYSAKTIDFERFFTKKRYFVLRAYEQSKLANVLFTYKLAEKTKDLGIVVNALHPGFVYTPIGTKGGNKFFSFVWDTASRLFGRTVEKGVNTHLFLSTAEGAAAISGQYFFDCKPKPSSVISYDKDLQDRLWEESEKISDLKFL